MVQVRRNEIGGGVALRMCMSEYAVLPDRVQQAIARESGHVQVIPGRFGYPVLFADFASTPAESTPPSGGGPVSAYFKELVAEREAQAGFATPIASTRLAKAGR